jgi:thymidine kinase
MKKAPIVFHYGCMASEKSLALIQEYRKSRSVDEVCLCYVFSSSKDGNHIISRFLQGEGKRRNQEIKIPATGVRNSKSIYDHIEKYIRESYRISKSRGLVPSRLRLNALIDEVQLFDEGIKSVVEDLAYNGVRVVCAGLNLDFRGEPFPLVGKNIANETAEERGRYITVPEIMGVASELYIHYARCAHIMDDGAACGANATRTQRFRDVEHKDPSHYEDPTIEVDPKKYIPSCEEHHVVPGKHRGMLFR